MELTRGSESHQDRESGDFIAGQETLSKLKENKRGQEAGKQVQRGRKTKRETEREKSNLEDQGEDEARQFHEQRLPNVITRQGAQLIR